MNMKTWKVTRAKDGRFEAFILYGNQWIKIGWWHDRIDAVRYVRAALNG